MSFFHPIHPITLTPGVNNELKLILNILLKLHPIDSTTIVNMNMNKIRTTGTYKIILSRLYPIYYESGKN